MAPDALNDTAGVRMTFDPEADAAYIYLRYPVAAGEAAEQVPVYDEDNRIELILDLDRDGHLIGIEVAGGAGNLLPPDVLARANRPPFSRG